jgi:hypothetical protein
MDFFSFFFIDSKKAAPEGTAFRCKVYFALELAG